MYIFICIFMSFLLKTFLSSDELVDLLKKESMMTGMYYL
jgi:hypothetical protein